MQSAFVYPHCFITVVDKMRFIYVNGISIINSRLIAIKLHVVLKSYTTISSINLLNLMLCAVLTPGLYCGIMVLFKVNCAKKVRYLVGFFICYTNSTIYLAFSNQ